MPFKNTIQLILIVEKNTKEIVNIHYSITSSKYKTKVVTF